jgi:hypothetical protein
MNKVQLLSLTLILLITACKKDDDTPPSSSGGGGGGKGGGGTNGNGLVTSWSPLKPYRDDVITLTGGPFNTNEAMNSVTSLGDAFDIISVSGTQLVVQPPNGWAPTSGGFSNLYIQSGNAMDTIPYIYWKRPMRVIQLEDNLDDFLFGAPARPGDSVVVYGSGFTPSGMSVNIGGTTQPGPYFVDSAFYGRIHFRIPVSMGSGDNESTLTTNLLTVSNADGRTDTLTIGWAPTPDMEIYSLDLLGGGSVFGLSEMNGSGQVLNFIVNGKYLRADATWNLSGPSPTNGTLGVGGYPNTVPIVVNPVSMSPGNYTLQITGTTAFYGFQLTP